MSEKVVIYRTGDRPLSFVGVLLAQSDGQMVNGREQNRWHDVSIWRDEAGCYVVHIDYCTAWQGEIGHSQADVLCSPEAVVEWLREYLPCEHLGGYPAHPHYQERQARLEADIARRYQQQVSEVLRGEEFHEIARNSSPVP